MNEDSYFMLLYEGYPNFLLSAEGEGIDNK
jgi:hypothetical protein